MVVLASLADKDIYFLNSKMLESNPSFITYPKKHITTSISGYRISLSFFNVTSNNL